MATKYWRPLAEPVSQIYTWTFGGTWVAGETVTFTCFKRFAKLTIGTDVTVADIVRAVSAMINAANADVAKTSGTADETYSIGGREIPEFTEFTADYTATVLTITTTAGIHTLDSTGTLVLAVTTNSALGTIGAATSVQAASGPTFYNNANNWSDGSVPGNNDTTIFDRGGNCSDGLINTATAVNLVRLNSFQSNIGRPRVHPTLGYVDYRKLSLDQPNAAAQTQTITIGEIGSPIKPKGATLLNLASTAGTATNVYVYDSAAGDNVFGDTVQINGGNTVSFYGYKGSVGGGMDRSAAATTFSTTFHVGYVGSQDGDLVVRLGANASFAGATTINQYGGTLYLQNGGSNVTLMTKGGTCYQLPSLVLVGFTIYPNATLVLKGGSASGNIVLEASANLKVETLGTYTVGGTASIHKNSNLSDPFNLLSVTGTSSVVAV